MIVNAAVAPSTADTYHIVRPNPLRDLGEPAACHVDLLRGGGSGGLGDNELDAARLAAILGLGNLGQESAHGRLELRDGLRVVLMLPA